LILPVLLAVAGLLWFYSTKDSAQLDWKKALEERISRIPLTAEALLPSEAAKNLPVKSVTTAPLELSLAPNGLKVLSN